MLHPNYEPTIQFREEEAEKGEIVLYSKNTNINFIVGLAEHCRTLTLQNTVEHCRSFKVDTPVKPFNPLAMSNQQI